MCSQKGLNCGADHKVLAQELKSAVNQRKVAKVVKIDPDDDIQIIQCVPCEPRPPLEQTLPPFEKLYMEFYWRTSGMWFDLINDRVSDTAHPLANCAAHRFGLHISSRLVRSAVLYYSSFRKDRQLSYTGMQYLAQFFELAREAIDRESNVELVYACYVMCLCEMTCERRLYGDFENHADGFMISYENLVRSGELTLEEYTSMGQAYDLINQMRQVASSRWHQDENWFGFAQTVTQRLDSATSRALHSTKTVTTSNNRSVWIPKSHHLVRAEDLVYRLCKLFNQLASIRKHETAVRNFSWIDTAAAIERSLNAFAGIIFSPITMFDPQQNSLNLYVLKDGVTTLPGDKFTRQLLTLYYIFLVQYHILVLEWSDSTWSEAIESSLAICRLFPSPHESNYPAPEVRFFANRGFFFALVLAAESHNIAGRSSFRLSADSLVNPNIKARLVDAYTLLEPVVT